MLRRAGAKLAGLMLAAHAQARRAQGGGAAAPLAALTVVCAGSVLGC